MLSGLQWAIRKWQFSPPQLLSGGTFPPFRALGSLGSPLFPLYPGVQTTYSTGPNSHSSTHPFSVHVLPKPTLTRCSS